MHRSDDLVNILPRKQAWKCFSEPNRVTKLPMFSIVETFKYVYIFQNITLISLRPIFLKIGFLGGYIRTARS